MENSKYKWWQILGMGLLYLVFVFASCFIGFLHPVCWAYFSVLAAFLAWSSRLPKASPTASAALTARLLPSSSSRNPPLPQSTSVLTMWPRTEPPAPQRRRSSSATTWWIPAPASSPRPCLPSASGLLAHSQTFPA